MTVCFEARRVAVYVRFGDVEQMFMGSVEKVRVCLNRFFGEFVPYFQVARKLVLNLDLQGWISDFEGLISFWKAVYGGLFWAY